MKKPLTKKYTKLDPITTKTLKEYIFDTVLEVRQSIKALLPEQFVIMYDGWTADGTSTHYVATYAMWTNSYGSVKRFLLSCAPLLNQADYSADSHVDYLAATLGLYGKTFSNVEAFSGDNCSTNKRVASLLNIPLIGCASHRLNLAAQLIFEQFSLEIDKVNKLMVDLRSLKNRAKLRMETHLQPEIRNQTRWSSTFSMLLKYQMIEKELDKCDFDASVLAKFPSALEKQTIFRLIKALKELESVSKTLQENDSRNDLYAVRTLFDELIVFFQVELDIDLTHKLGPDALIIQSKDFENAVVKVQSGREDFLTFAEATTISKFLKTPREEPDLQDNSDRPQVSLAERVRLGLQQEKRARMEPSDRYDYADNYPWLNIHVSYRSMKHLSPTSNLVERLFSAAGINMTDFRKNMAPRSLEAALLLTENKELWTPATIDVIIKKRGD